MLLPASCGLPSSAFTSETLVCPPTRVKSSSLSPGKAPGKKPKLDEKARRLLEADVEERPFAKLSDRQEYLKKVAGVSVSESTLSRVIRKMGFGRKKGRWVRVSGTSS